VALQSLLIALIPISILVGPSWPDSVDGPLRVVGAACALAGGALVVVAARTLGRSFTPYPRPATGGRLVESGPYRYVRHPVYSAGALFCVGIALAYSPLALVPVAVLAILWGLKVSVEERFLRAAYDGYERYATRTRYRLVPFVY